jgi:ribosomal protein L11 methyltransferase
MSDDTTYISVTFSDLASAEDVQALLLPFEPLGFLEEDSSWTCYLDSAAWKTGGEEQFVSLMKLRFPALAYSVQELAKQNWNKEWEESITPIEVSDRFVIAPSWNIPPETKHRIVLVIDPKMSFGTGFHETTRLMLRLMEAAELRGARVLDVGTGTGVLAIAAMKLGAAAAVGVDIDEWSYENAMENASRNGVADGVMFAHGSIEAAQGTYGVVLSNITRNDNIALFPGISRLLDGPSQLIVSGFYQQDVDDVNAAAEQLGFSLVATMTEMEWAAMRFERRA